MLGPISDDLRHSLRALWSRPLLAISITLTLTLTIGINIAVFSAIEGQLLKPLPYPHGDRLVSIYNSYPKSGVVNSGNTVADYLDRRAQASNLLDSALYYDYSFDLTESTFAQRVAGIVATPSLFDTLQVNARLGRTFDADEASSADTRVVVLSDALWHSHFASDPSIVGKDIRISGQSYRVIGVMPANFMFPRPEVQLWVPFVFSEKQKSDAMRGFEFAQSIGRLQPDASIAQLNSEFDRIAASTMARLSVSNGGDESEFLLRARDGKFTGRARNLHDELVGDIRPTLWLLQAAALVVLLIACANIANLMLVRTIARQQELAIRATLGASRIRLARQLALESLLLAAAGGVAGIGLATLCIKLIRLLRLDGAASGFTIGLNASVLMFALALSVVTCALFALLPVLSIRYDRPAQALHGGSREQSGKRSANRTRNVLAIAQIALAVALLVNGALLIHSFWRLQQESPGFDSRHLVSMNFNLSRDQFRDVDKTAQFRERVIEAVQAVPGVQSAATISGVPFSADYDSTNYFFEDSEHVVRSTSAYMQSAGEGLFRTMGITLLKGRDFDSRDNKSALPVAIIDAELAQWAFGDTDAIGKRIATRALKGLSWHTVVGIVATIKRNQLSDAKGNATVYLPMQQSTSRIFRIVIRSEIPIQNLLGPLRSAVARIDPEQPVWGITTMDARIDDSLAERRTPMLLLALFAGCALALSGIGIYGVIAFSVSRRTSEIGVRMSLGASSAAILRLVIGDGAKLILVAIAIGSVLALMLGQLLRSQLFGVSMIDPLSIASTLVVVIATSLLACWIPARRAATMSPLQALRCE